MPPYLSGALVGLPILRLSCRNRFNFQCHVATGLQWPDPMLLSPSLVCCFFVGIFPDIYFERPLGSGQAARWRRTSRSSSPSLYSRALVRFARGMFLATCATSAADQLRHVLPPANCWRQSPTACAKEEAGRKAQCSDGSCARSPSQVCYVCCLLTRPVSEQLCRRVRVRRGAMSAGGWLRSPRRLPPPRRWCWLRRRLARGCGAVT